jgi:hypothetical protein
MAARAAGVQRVRGQLGPSERFGTPAAHSGSMVEELRYYGGGGEEELYPYQPLFEVGGVKIISSTPLGVYTVRPPAHDLVSQSSRCF